MPEATFIWLLSVFFFSSSRYTPIGSRFSRSNRERFLMAALVLLLDAASALCFHIRRLGLSEDGRSLHRPSRHDDPKSPSGAGRPVFGMIDILFDLRRGDTETFKALRRVPNDICYLSSERRSAVEVILKQDVPGLGRKEIR